MNNLISIIIPMYNAEQYIAETLDSILAQSYDNWECLIMDDGSNDNSAKVAKSICSNDKRFNYFFQQNRGPSAARNFGLQKSSGEYIHFLDADDVLLQNSLEILLNESKKVGPKIILYSGVLLGDSDNIHNTSPIDRRSSLGIDISSKELYTNFGVDFIFIPGCILFPKEVFEFSVWNEELSHSEDWDLYLQISKFGYTFRNVSEELLIYRNTPQSLSKEILKTIESNYQILDKWRGNSFLIYSKRCSLLLKKNIKLFLTNKINKITNPITFFEGTLRDKYFLYIIIFFITIYYIMIEIFSFFNRRIIK